MLFTVKQDYLIETHSLPALHFQWLVKTTGRPILQCYSLRGQTTTQLTACCLLDLYIKELSKDLYRLYHVSASGQHSPRQVCLEYSAVLQAEDS